MMYFSTDFWSWYKATSAPPCCVVFAWCLSTTTYRFPYLEKANGNFNFNQLYTCSINKKLKGGWVIPINQITDVLKYTKYIGLTYLPWSHLFLVMKVLVVLEWQAGRPQTLTFWPCCCSEKYTSTTASWYILAFIQTSTGRDIGISINIIWVYLKLEWVDHISHYSWW